MKQPFPRRPDRTIDVQAVIRESNHLISGRELPPTAEELHERAAEDARRSRRWWAAAMLALDVDTATSILCGLRVRAGNLDGVVLSHALRGDPLPSPDKYLAVTIDMLDAVSEAGLAKR